MVSEQEQGRLEAVGSEAFGGGWSAVYEALLLPSEEEAICLAVLGAVREGKGHERKELQKRLSPAARAATTLFLRGVAAGMLLRGGLDREIFLAVLASVAPVG